MNSKLKITWNSPVILTFVAICLLFFAFSTILSWSYYGERCWGYLSNNNRMVGWIYKIIFILLVILSATMDLSLAWDIADTFNGMMAIPNLIALLALSGVTVKLTKEHFAANK